MDSKQFAAVIREDATGKFFVTAHAEGRDVVCLSDLPSAAAAQVALDDAARVYKWTVTSISHRSASGVWS